MREIFAMMKQDLLAVMGQEAFLRGDVPCRVHIRKGVQTVGSDDNIVANRTVATLDATLNPKRGDTITGHPDGNFKLDAPLKDNGYLDAWFVLPLP